MSGLKLQKDFEAFQCDKSHALFLNQNLLLRVEIVFDMLQELIRKNILSITGVIVGAVSGFLYWKYVGCLTGTCKITSSPVNSTLYFALMGFLFFNLFKKENHVK
jgi:hypothetical protein